MNSGRMTSSTSSGASVTDGQLRDQCQDDARQHQQDRGWHLQPGGDGLDAGNHGQQHDEQLQRLDHKMVVTDPQASISGDHGQPPARRNVILLLGGDAWQE